MNESNLCVSDEKAALEGYPSILHQQIYNTAIAQDSTANSGGKSRIDMYSYGNCLLFTCKRCVIALPRPTEKVNERFDTR